MQHDDFEDDLAAVSIPDVQLRDVAAAKVGFKACISTTYKLAGACDY